MNVIPRPDEALARRLRGIADQARAALRGVAALGRRMSELEARVAELERRDEGEG